MDPHSCSPTIERVPIIGSRCSQSHAMWTADYRVSSAPRCCASAKGGNRDGCQCPVGGANPSGIFTICYLRTQ